MRRRFEFKQLLMGMSMSRYFPASGTAGFDRSCVRGKSRVPRPPPRITARQSFMAEEIRRTTTRRCQARNGKGAGRSSSEFTGVGEESVFEPPCRACNTAYGGWFGAPNHAGAQASTATTYSNDSLPPRPRAWGLRGSQWGLFRTRRQGHGQMVAI